MIVSREQITNVLTRLRGCAGWSTLLLFKSNKARFSCDEASILLDDFDFCKVNTLGRAVYFHKEIGTICPEILLLVR